MNQSIRLGRIWGIPVGLHYSWFLVFGLLTWSLATGYFPNEYPLLSTFWFLVLGVVTTVLFFGSVLAHELGHSLIALRNSIPVKGITLFIFGGVAQIAREPDSPGAEFRIAIAGPIVSLALGLFFGALYILDQAIPYLAAPSLYLMRINLILAFFNLIPGFPLDGGRVFRAIIWWRTNNFRRATQIASVTGQLVAFGFIGFGIFAIFTGQFFNGIWLVFIGWFLQNAASATYSQLNLQQSLQGVTVSQAMTRDCNEVPGLTTVQQLVDDRILTGGNRCFYVSHGDNLVGMVTLKDISAIPQTKWRFTTVDQVMVPVDRAVKVEPSTGLWSALQTMDSSNIAQVPVVQDGELIGTLSREQILHYIRLRSELGV